MAGLLLLFGAFSGTDINYKTVERLYSDDFVKIALHNMLVITINRKCAKSIDITGDGTGYP